MKKKFLASLGFILFFFCLLIFNYENLFEKASKNSKEEKVNSSDAIKTVISSSASHYQSSSFSSFSSSILPLPQIKNLLDNLYKTPMPIFERPPGKFVNANYDVNFDYQHASDEQLKESSLNGDNMASLLYAQKLQSRLLNYLSDNKDIYWPPLLEEIQKYYILALQQGMESSAARDLSNLYTIQSPWHDNVQAIAWLKIAYSLGAFGWTQCLRDPASCTASEFNNFNQEYRFTTCVKSAEWDPCEDEQFSDADKKINEYISLYGFKIKK